MAEGLRHRLDDFGSSRRSDDHGRRKGLGRRSDGGSPGESTLSLSLSLFALVLQMRSPPFVRRRASPHPPSGAARPCFFVFSYVLAVAVGGTRVGRAGGSSVWWHAHVCRSALLRAYVHAGSLAEITHLSVRSSFLVVYRGKKTRPFNHAAGRVFGSASFMLASSSSAPR